MSVKYAKRTQNKKRVQVMVPLDVAKEIDEAAAERGVTSSYLYTELVTEAYNHMKTYQVAERIENRLETVYLASELIGAKLDEIVKLIAARMPINQNLTAEEKQDLALRASKVARAAADAATKNVEAYRRGTSCVEPLGVEKLIDSFRADNT